MLSKAEQRKKRHIRIKKKVSGNAEKPRLCVFRSYSHMYAQIIDDQKGHTLVSASSLNGEFKDYKGHRGNALAAQKVGESIGKKALEQGIKKVIFDRAGYPYHGRVKALADAARKAGLEFPQRMPPPVYDPEPPVIVRSDPMTPQ